MERTILPPGDPMLINNIVYDLKAQGIFDEFRQECLADVDTKPSFQNLSQRVDGYTTKFLANEVWNPDLNKNELRNKLRRHINESDMLNVGIDHVVEQVINAKARQLFLPRIKEVVEQYLGLREKPFDKEKKKTNISQENENNKEKSNQEIAINSTIFTNENNSDAVTNLSLHISKPKNNNPNLIPVKIDTNLIFKNDKNKEENTVAPSNKSEFINDNSESADIDMKNLQDFKELISKNIKSPESDLFDNQIKHSKEEDPNLEINKNEESKSETFDISLSFEGNSSRSLSNKSQNDAKIDSSTKFKYEVKPLDKTKPKVKPQVKHKSSNDQNKIKHKEKSDVVKATTEKSNKISLSKIVKNQNKDSSSISALKSNNFIKNIKLEKNTDTIHKKKDLDVKTSKTIDSSFKKSHSKMDFSKKEFDNSKSKVVSNKSDDKMHSEKLNVHKKKHESSNISRKKNKISFPYSSSYDSSQESDQEKISIIKEKHFTKHFPKKENISNENSNNDKEKKIKAFKDKMLDNKKEKLNITCKDALLTQDSDGSNSYESHSSSNTTNTSKETSSNSSDDIIDTSSELDGDQKKKPDVKNKKTCQVKQLPQTPPPSPPTGNLPCPSSTSDQSSHQESSSGTSESDDEEEQIIPKKNISDAHENVPIKLAKKSNELPNVDNRNLFFTSSSDEEFDHFSAPDKQFQESKDSNDYDSDVTVSSVHTSDLSSFEDQLTLSSEEDNNEKKKMHLKKKFTLKEATRFIQKKSDDDAIQNTSSEFAYLCTLTDDSPTKQSLSFPIEKELSSSQEPKRALKRERKLNPKYASSEYASIFNSKQKTKVKNSKFNQIKDNVRIFSSHAELDKNINQTTSYSNENTNATKKIVNEYHDKVEENYQCYSESCENIEDKTTNILVNKTKDNVELNEIELINPLSGISTSSLPVSLEDLGETSSSSEEIQSIDDITQLQVSINTDSNSENECSLTFSIAKNSNIPHINNNSRKRKSNQNLNSTYFKHLSANLSEVSTNSDFMTNENKPLNNRKANSIHLLPATSHRLNKSRPDVFRKTTLLRQKFKNNNMFRSSFKKVIIKK